MHTITIPQPSEFWKEQGGIFAGLIRIDDITRAIIVAPGEEGESPNLLSYGEYGHEIENANSFNNGLANTEALIKSDREHPAAQWANSLELNGFGDWYLPSQKELNLCYINAQDQFEKSWYWSSTQSSAYFAYIQGFVDGGQDDYHKVNAARVRAVRRFVINSSI